MRVPRSSTIPSMPEGDSLHRAARRLQVLVGETVEVESPNPRAAATGVAEQLDGRRLEAVEAVGKNLLLSFEGGLVLRSHLRMSGRWTVGPRLGVRGPALARAAWARPRGGAVERPRARAEQARGPQPRAGHPGAAAGPRPDARKPPSSRRPRGRRCPSRPASRRRDREHVEGGGALASRVSPWRPSEKRRRRASRPCSSKRRA